MSHGGQGRGFPGEPGGVADGFELGQGALDLLTFLGVGLAQFGRFVRVVDVEDAGQAGKCPGGGRFHDFTFSLDTEDGTRRFVARVSGIYDTSGQPGGYVLMVKDADCDADCVDEAIDACPAEAISK